MTDLHAGISSDPWLFPNLEQVLLDDLAKQHPRSGPYHLLFFTGDLTQKSQKGSTKKGHYQKGEFDIFQERMDRISDVLRPHGQAPLLLAVPGNHDLLRPKDPEIQTIAAHWFSPANSAVRDNFYKGKGNFYNEICKAFAPWKAWWSTQAACKDPSYCPGLLPGDYAISVACNGLKVGVVGMNSAFLQLEAGDKKGKLAIHARQLMPIWKKKQTTLPAWAKEHDLCVLLTHHPTDWLEEGDRKDLYAEINPAQETPRFPLHLFGHDHEGQTHQWALGGAGTRTELLGRSLFGLEHYGNTVARAHGYTIGRVEMAAGQRNLHLWPRTAKNPSGQGWTLVADTDRNILQDECTRPLDLGPSPRKSAPNPP